MKHVLTGVAAALAALAAASSAWAHATVSPPVAKAKALQIFTLAVPTEKENTVTTKIVLNVPSGFSIDSFVPPPPGWKQTTAQTGSGDDAVADAVLVPAVAPILAAVAVHRGDEHVQLLASEAALASGRAVTADVSRVGPAADRGERDAQVAGCL